MIGTLPKSININGREIPIRSNFRTVLLILEAFSDPNLTPNEKKYIELDALYNIKNLKPEEYEEALKKANWFIDGGKSYESNKNPIKIIDWKQDEAMIFSAINRVANKETRECEYIHWWTFLGYFAEVGECLFSQVVNIRNKRAKGKKLEKYEQEYFRENRNLIDIKEQYSEEEQAEIDRLNEIFK